VGTGSACVNALVKAVAFCVECARERTRSLRAGDITAMVSGLVVQAMCGAAFCSEVIQEDRCLPRVAFRHPNDSFELELCRLSIADASMGEPLAAAPRSRASHCEDFRIHEICLFVLEFKECRWP